MTYSEHYEKVLEAAHEVYEAIDKANSHGLNVYVGIETIYKVGGLYECGPEVSIEHVSQYHRELTADEKQCKRDVFNAMMNLASVLTHAAEFGYAFQIKRYRDGTPVVMKAESTIEA